jgi:heat shock protein HtpX
MKRVALLLATNLAILLVLSATASLLGINQIAQTHELHLPSLLLFAGLFGFGGAFLSLLLSKPIAKWATGAKKINDSPDPTHQWLVETTQSLAHAAHLEMPEVAIYPGEPNAFATGAFKNSALVAVSTGLLEKMEKEEVEAVLAHEVAHIANGDMVTMTLLTGILNTFVIFIARVLGFLIDKLIFRNEGRGGIGYFLTVILCEILLGILASLIVAWFSRQREFRADAGAASLQGSQQPMIQALRKLGTLQNPETTEGLPASVAALGISGKIRGGLLQAFSTHPPLEERIAALQTQPAQTH